MHVGTIFHATHCLISDLSAIVVATHHVAEKPRLRIIEMRHLVIIYCGSHLKIVVSLSLCLLTTFLPFKDHAVSDIVALTFIYVGEFHKGSHDWTIGAGMLRDVARTPSDAAMLTTILIKSAVPTVEHVCRQVFSLIKIPLLPCHLVSLKQLTHDPHLIIIHVQHACHISRTLSASTVHSVDCPGGGAGVRCQGVSAGIKLQIIHEIGEKLSVACEMSIIESRFPGSLLLLHSLQH